MYAVRPKIPENIYLVIVSIQKRPRALASSLLLPSYVPCHRVRCGAPQERVKQVAEDNARLKLHVRVSLLFVIASSYSFLFSVLMFVL